MLKFSRKPLLVASGCSHTDANFVSINHPEMDTSWPKWPQIFAEEHGYDHINVAKSGAGNDTISNSIIDTVTDYPETKLVLILWSGWGRLNFYGKNFNPSALSVEAIKRRLRNAKDNDEQTIILKEWYKTYAQDYSSLVSLAFSLMTVQKIVNRNFRLMYQTIDFLNRRNIQYICASADTGINGILRHLHNDTYDPLLKLEKIADYRKMLESILENRYFDLLESPNFWGYPMFKQIGGQSLMQLFWKNESPYSDCIISKYDTHPNAKGQEKIAEIFSETYKKVYS